MTVNVKDIKILWVRGAGRCSICKSELLHEAKNSSQTSLIGENCHIVGANQGSARWDEPSLSDEERGRYPNLILLCRNHHKIIDSDVKSYTIAKLHQIKADHELWVESFFAKVTNEDTHYEKIIDLAVQNLCLENWDFVSDHALRLLVSSEFIDGATNFSTFVWRAVWPGTRPDLEKELRNLSERVEKFVKHFCSNACLDPQDLKWWAEDRGFKNFWNPRYNEFQEFSEKWVKVTHQLLFNVVVALNHFADIVRATMNPMFLVSYGKFTVHDSMGVSNNLVSAHFFPNDYLIVDSMPERPLP